MVNYQRNVIFLLIGIIAFVIFYNTVILGHSNGKIIPNHTVVCGDITDMRTGKGTNVIYEFSFDGKKYKDNVLCPAMTMAAFKQGKRKLLIVFEKGNPGNNRILADVDDFARYMITENDTLNVPCDWYNH
ncbi:MAG: hypothetical protein ABJB86_07280 [Bacteroidota bacterium]